MDAELRRELEAKVYSGERLTREDGVALYESDDLVWLGRLAHHVRTEKNGGRVMFNVNRHLNLTNVCSASCAYCSFQRKPGEKDAYMAMHSAWVVEWAELDSMRRADTSMVKAFITSPCDSFRPPYAREVVSRPRSSVIVGTVNSGEFLTDHTGNRRYWIVPVPGRIDTDWVREQREQLWAEAVEVWNSGREWWLSEEEERANSEVHDEFMTHDAIESIICPYLDLVTGPVTVENVCLGALDLKKGQIDKAIQMRVSACLIGLGYERKQSRINGVKLRYWVKSNVPT